jgi:hypothetical protein
MDGDTASVRDRAVGNDLAVRPRPTSLSAGLPFRGLRLRLLRTGRGRGILRSACACGEGERKEREKTADGLSHVKRSVVDGASM